MSGPDSAEAPPPASLGLEGERATAVVAAEAKAEADQEASYEFDATAAAALSEGRSGPAGEGHGSHVSLVCDAAPGPHREAGGGSPLPPGAAPGAAAPSGGGAGPAWKQEFQSALRGRIQAVIKERTGPSFEERMSKAAARMRRQAKASEDEQKKILEDAVRRARARPMESKPRQRDDEPESIESISRRRRRDMAELEAQYALETQQRRTRMVEREPLFRLTEVAAAFEACRRRQEERRQQLKRDEQEMWKHLEGLQRRVLDKPLQVEDFRRPDHSVSVPDLRLVPQHTQATPLEAKVGKAVSQKWFKESQWGQEVARIHYRADHRQRLHEIKYPPKFIPPKVFGPPEPSGIDLRMREQIGQKWYQETEWAAKVKEIKERMDNRPKLHEITYPPKR